MTSSHEFVLQLKAMMAGNATSKLGKAKAAADAAVGAFNDVQAKLGGLSKALERNGAAAAALRTKLVAANNTGDARGAARLTAQLAKLKAAEVDLRGQLDATTAELAQQAQAASRAATEFASLRDATERVGVDGVKTADGLSKLPGPLGGVSTLAKELQEAWTDLSGNLGKFGAAAAIGAVAVVALTAAIAVAVVKTAAWAVGLANARRNLSLTLEAMAGSAEGGKALGGVLTDVSKATELGSDRLLDLSRELKNAGVSATDMPAALKAVALQEAALGDTSGTGALIDSLKEGKTSASAMAAEMEAKFGGVVAKRMLSLESQATTFQRQIGELFGGLNIEPFLEGLKTLVGLFDANTASGRLMSRVFSGIFQPLLDGATGAIPTIEAYILRAMIAAVNFGIQVKRTAASFSFGEGEASLTRLPGLIYVGEAAMATLRTTAMVVQGSILMVVAVVSALSSAFAWLQSAGSTAWDGIKTTFDEVKAKFEGFSLSQVASDMIAGLVEGITTGATAVAEALSGVVDGAINAAKAKLGIKSPSKVFMEIGRNTTEGMSMGLDDGADDVRSSMQAVVEPPAALPAGPSRSGKLGGSTTINVEAINIHGVKGAEELGDRIVGAIRQAIAQATEELGGDMELTPS
jgi:hypothetical protein